MNPYDCPTPQDMPVHFFSEAIAVHRETAIRAKIDRQNYSVCPRYWYQDADFRCKCCGREFPWTAAEQQVWFEEYHFYVDSRPRHCRVCRQDRRRQKRLRQEYDRLIVIARQRGQWQSKQRIVDIVAELQAATSTLPRKMLRARERFQKQLRPPSHP